METSDTATTAITNAMASEPGFPAETTEGDIVNIVSKKRNDQGLTIMTDSDGNEYVQQTDSPRLLVGVVEDGVYTSDVNSPLPGPDGTPAAEEETPEAA